ncbi:calcium-translocating P-type ATPase [Piromyces finnis]|uniref:Calcium-transporting ATPase 2 n=1 Tax=Piromyces finnis TaxID=1754191 RepID=A0A1Y1UZM7_9FUNG|nr:calcium-translocating P-type ATPase [Piromyces finnis]|eukprot:ORX44182.1 calcium-translocating P-type ATPase [Piromyces finnis]
MGDNTNNPYKFTAQQLSELVDPKNPELLEKYGGLKGIAEALKVDVNKGLPQVKADEPNQFAEREAVFGRNVLPETKSKSLLELMWIALHDRIMIILSIAAIVSLSIGLYEDFGPGSEESDEPKVHWIEGVAILISVFIVITAGSVNDYQKEKQFRALNAKKDDRKVKALRGGESVMISVFDVQVGDVLLLEPGDMLCADGIFIQGHNLKCDESAATGESDTIEKAQDKDQFILSGSKVTEGVGSFLVTAVGTNSFHGKTMMSLRTEDEDTPLQVKLNALAEKIAVIGTAAAVLMFCILIIKYIIQICTGKVEDKSFAAVLSEIVKIFISAITVVVVAVPEGLPLAVTLALAFATTRMLKDNNLVRVLNACETMGGATTVCSDKTGTLTQNKMTVVKGVAGRYFGFEGPEQIKKLADDLKNITGKTDPANKEIKDGAELLDVLIEGISINSTAFEGETDDGKIDFIGSKSETALLGMTKAMGIDYRTYRENPCYKVVQIYPFSSAKKSMATLIKVDRAAKGTGSGSFYRMHVKGASEIVLRYSTKALLLPEGGFKFAGKTKAPELPTIVPLSKNLAEDYNNNVIERFANESLRTFSLAYRDFEEEEFEAYLHGEVKEKVMEAIRKEEIEKLKREMAERKALEKGVAIEEDNLAEIMKEITDEQVIEDLPEIPEPTDEEILSHNAALTEIGNRDLTFMSLVGIEDPVRPGVPEAVATCRNAGVVVRMVTGDNINTARAIAAKCGIYTQGGIVMEGPRFRTLTEEQMDEILPRLQVLARSSPTDKQILVGRLKYLGETVAVTGDGTNDGPALKMADVGFSMGIAGTEVAKEASSIILMDDNFSSIVKALLWGRSVNDSVKKFLQFQLTVNITAVVVTFISAIFDGDNGSALTAVQLLWVNLIMDTLAALALATEKPTQDMLLRPPQNKRSPLITHSMWKMIIGEALFQIIVNFALLFAGPYIFSNWFGVLKDNGGVLNKGPQNNLQGEFEDQKTILKTMVFNTFVFLQIFNEINCRRIDNRLNVFTGILKNAYFISIFIFIAAAQVIIVFFGGSAFKTTPLNLGQWAICILLGFFSLPLGMVIRLIPDSTFAACLPKNPVESEPVDFSKPIPDFISPEKRNNTLDSTERHINAQIKWDQTLSALGSKEGLLFNFIHGGRSGRAMSGTISPRVQTTISDDMHTAPKSFAESGRAMTAPAPNAFNAKQAWKMAMIGVERQRKENNEV